MTSWYKEWSTLSGVFVDSSLNQHDAGHQLAADQKQQLDLSPVPTFQQALSGLLVAVERCAADEVYRLESQLQSLRRENEDLYRVLSEKPYVSHQHLKLQAALTGLSLQRSRDGEAPRYPGFDCYDHSMHPNRMEAIMESPREDDRGEDADVPMERRQEDRGPPKIKSGSLPRDPPVMTNGTGDVDPVEEDAPDGEEEEEEEGEEEEEDEEEDDNAPCGLDDDQWLTHLVLNSSFKRNRVVLKAAKACEMFCAIQEPERTSGLATFVHSKAFEALCITVIILNSLYTIYTTNYMVSTMTDQPTSFMNVADISFLAFYSTELVLKVVVHRLYFFCNIDMKWNLFDLALIVLAGVDLIMSSSGAEGTVDMTFMRSFRLLKLSKVLRMFRVLRFFADLRLMLDCVAGSFLSLLWCFVILGFFWIIFALLFVQGIAGYMIEKGSSLTKDEKTTILDSFGSVQVAIFTLFQAISGGSDWKGFYDIVSRVGSLNAALFVFYIIFFIFAICNIVTSIFIDKAMKLAQPDLEQLLFEKQREDWSNARELKKLCCDKKRSLCQRTSGQA